MPTPGLSRFLSRPLLCMFAAARWPVPATAEAPCSPRGNGALLIGALLVACGGDATAPHRPLPPTDASGLYWALRLDQEAITLSNVAPYNTIQLTATPHDANGAPLVGLGAATFRSEDPGRVGVTAGGLVTAVKPGQNIQVFAELSAGNVVHVDTAFIKVTTVSAPPMLASISFQADSARWALGGDGTFLTVFGRPTAIRAEDALGNPISGLAFNLVSSDPTVASIFRYPAGQIIIVPNRPGRITLIASATAYGITKADTVSFAIISAVLGVVSIRTRPVGIGGATALVFEATEVTISPGGTVYWFNITGQPVDVVFNDPERATERGTVWMCGSTDPGGAGNIPAFGDESGIGTGNGAANCRSRRFPMAGIYPYRSSSGATGRVIVSYGLPTS